MKEAKRIIANYSWRLCLGRRKTKRSITAIQSASLLIALRGSCGIGALKGTINEEENRNQELESDDQIRTTNHQNQNEKRGKMRDKDGTEYSLCSRSMAPFAKSRPQTRNSKPIKSRSRKARSVTKA